MEDFQEEGIASVESQEGRRILAYSRNSREARGTRAQRGRREVEGNYRGPEAVEGFHLPLLPCLLWVRLCFGVEKEHNLISF